jgi:hypothetical protein
LAYQLCCERGQAIVMVVRSALYNDDIFSLGKAGLLQPALEPFDLIAARFDGAAVERFIR